MAKAPAQSTEVAVVKTGELEDKKAQNAVLASQFDEYSGLGLENITSNDIAIPYFRILGPLSPQVNKRDGKYIQGAEPGMFFNSATSEIYEGEKGIYVIPCYYQRKFVEWTPRDKGGGRVAIYDIDNPIQQRTTKNEKGTDILPNGNELADTAEFYVILLTDEGPSFALISMTSTQLKKSRKWNTIIKNQRYQNNLGLFKPMPMMSVVYHLRTVEERNDKGTWFGYEMAKDRFLNLEDDEDHALFQMGVAFHDSVSKGAVKVVTDEEGAGATAPGMPDDNIPF
jgi:hypothetical protein